MAMAKKGEKSVPIKGLTDKRNFAVVITFTGDFLYLYRSYTESRPIVVSEETLSSLKVSTFPKKKSIVKRN